MFYIRILITLSLLTLTAITLYYRYKETTFNKKEYLKFLTTIFSAIALCVTIKIFMLDYRLSFSHSCILALLLWSFTLYIIAIICKKVIKRNTLNG